MQGSKCDTGFNEQLELLKEIYHYFYESRSFYLKALKIEEQNSFPDHLREYCLSLRHRALAFEQGLYAAGSVVLRQFTGQCVVSLGVSGPLDGLIHSTPHRFQAAWLWQQNGENGRALLGGAEQISGLYKPYLLGAVGIPHRVQQPPLQSAGPLLKSYRNHIKLRRTA